MMPTLNESIATCQQELQRAQAAKIAASAELAESVEQNELLAAREETASKQLAVLQRETAVKAIPFLISNRGRRPDVAPLLEAERELSLIRAARAWLASRLPRLRVVSLRSEGYALVREADLEEMVAKSEQRASAEALAQLRETLGPNASVTIASATFQERKIRAEQLVERGKRLLDEAAQLQAKLPAA